MSSKFDYSEYDYCKANLTPAQQKRCEELWKRYQEIREQERAKSQQPCR